MDEKTSLAELQPGEERWQGWESVFEMNFNGWCYQTRLIHLLPACVMSSMRYSGLFHCHFNLGF